MADKGPVRRKLHDLTADDVAPLEAQFDARYPDRLREIATILHMVLVDHGVQDGAGLAQAPKLAIALTEALSQEIGGQGFYINKGTAYRRRKQLDVRDLQIRAEYRGWNLAILARKYQLTEVRLRQIVGETDAQKAVRHARREQFERAQNTLFAAGSDTDA